MKKYIVFYLILVFISTNLSCKKDCQNIEVDRSMKIVVFNSITSEDISSTLTNDNFKIIQKDNPGISLKFDMNFDETPISALVISYACESIDEDEYDISFNIIYESLITGEIETVFSKVNKGCDDCDFRIKSMELIDIEGDILLEDLNNQMTLYID